MNDLRLTRRQWNGLALAGLGSCVVGGRSPAADTPHLPEVAEGDVAPLPFVDGSFTIVALPDTQHYAERFPQHFHNQTKWIAENKEKHDIQFVVHLGDITNRNTKEQWEVAQAAIQRLDGKVPYSLVVGNHDCGPKGDCSTRESYFNEYFPVDNAKRQETFGGVMEKDRRENSYHTFSTRGQKFLVLALEFGPRDEVVAWADGIVARHPDHLALLTTHAYMYFDETRYDWAQYGKRQSWNPHTYGIAGEEGSANDGQELWEKTVGIRPNYFMTLNGHVLRDGLARITTAGKAGNDVHQMLVNYQMKPEGGEGYLRLLEFLPDMKTVQVRCYSPSTGLYKTDAQNQFTLALQPSLGAKA